MTPGWELVSDCSLKREGLPCHLKPGAVLCCLSLRCLAPPRPDRERESAWRWSLGSQKDLWCGPSFLLGWDKPGSVAPLRLVGCLIETPAPSWAYFYSIFSLSFFFLLLPYSDLSYSYFFFSTLDFCLLGLSLYHCPLLPRCWDVFQPVCMTEENEKNLHRSVSGLDPNIHLLFFPPFCLAVFILRSHLPRWQELLVTGLAVSMQCIYSKCFKPYAEMLFIYVNNRHCKPKNCPVSHVCLH